MGNFGLGEMALIAVFGLLVFGPQRLPEIARNVGGFIREFKAVASGVTQEFKAELDAPAGTASTVPSAPVPAAAPESLPSEDSESPPVAREVEGAGRRT